jgi:hypothetical protein
MQGSAPTPKAEYVPRPIVTRTEGGKGYRQCPSCELYVPIITAQCKCGHTFVKTEKKAVVPPSEIKVSLATVPDFIERKESRPLWDGITRISVPAGECPVTLRSTLKEDVLEWADKVRVSYRTKSQIISDEGLTYFLRRMYDFQTPEYANCRNYILNSLTEV